MYKNTAVICFSKVNGGMELAAVKLARLLSEDQKIYFLARENGFIEQRKKEHFSDYNIKLKKLNFKFRMNPLTILEIRSYIKEKNIKNVIYLGVSDVSTLYFSFLNLNVNFIIRQGSYKTTSKKTWFKKLIYSGVNSYVANCEYIKNNIEDIFPLNEKTLLTRVYSSLKLLDIKREEKISNRLELIHVGRINEMKGQLEAIKACSVLYENNIDFRFQILGDFQDKSYYEEILKYLESCEYKDKIELLGYKSNVIDHLIKADIFLFPSKLEGMSNAIIESLGYGLIPIIYDNSSSSEFADFGFFLHLVEDGDEQAFVDTLLSCANNFEIENKNIDSNMLLARKVFAPYREKCEYHNLLS